MERNRKLGDASGSWKKGRFLARREKKLGTVWEKWFERGIMENVTGRRTGTQRPYVKFLEKKIPERWLTNAGWEGRNQDTTGRLCKRWSLLEDCQMRKSEGAVALLQSHLTEWTVWIPSIPWGEILVKFSLWMTLKCLLQVDRLFHHKWNLNTKLTLILFCQHSNIKYAHTYIHTCMYVCVSVYIHTKSILIHDREFAWLMLPYLPKYTGPNESCTAA